MLDDDELEHQLARLPPPPETADPAACLGAAMLGAYLEGALTDGEREMAENHLSLCASCLEALSWAARRDAVPERAVPRRLHERALALEASHKPRAGVWLALAASVAVAVGTTALLQRSAPEPAAPGGAASAGSERSHPVQHGGAGFARSSVARRHDAVVTGWLRLTHALTAALEACAEAPGPAACRGLLQQLEAGPLRVPSARVLQIEIAPALVAALARGTPPAESEISLGVDGVLSLRGAE